MATTLGFTENGQIMRNRRRVTALLSLGLSVLTVLTILPAFNLAVAADAGSSTTTEELQVDVAKRGLGKEVSIRKGNQEWFMMIEVTPENTVIVRQEKNGETYLVDESETHDRAMTHGEVDTAITDYINSVKTRAKAK